jgi:PTS system mannose-specific IIA component
MRRFFIASHGRFASGIKTSLEILLGKADQVTVFDAYCDETRLDDALNAFYITVEANDQVFLLSDLYGGSVNSELYCVADRSNTTLIAGINLALVLELVACDQWLSEQDLLEIIENSRQALRLVKQDKEALVSDDFF